LHSRPEEQELQATPPAPHDPFDSLARTSHVVPLQHPAQDVPPHVQVPVDVEQVCPELHAAQAAPPVPHSTAFWLAKGRQVVPLQQPPGHDVASHTQVPFVLSQSLPAPHAAQAAPPAPQEAVDSEA
jgi:hypothetical protein